VYVHTTSLIFGKKKFTPIPINISVCWRIVGRYKSAFIIRHHKMTCNLNWIFPSSQYKMLRTCRSPVAESEVRNWVTVCAYASYELHCGHIHSHILCNSFQSLSLGKISVYLPYSLQIIIIMYYSVFFLFFSCYKDPWALLMEDVT
jgi:hypothetical protein